MAVQPWGNWLRETVQAQPGRIGAVIFGSALVVAGLVVRAEEVVASVLVGSGALGALAGFMLPWLEELQVTKHTRLKTRPAPEFLGEAVARIRSGEVDAESVDLPGDDEVAGARYRLGERSIEWLLSRLGGALAGCEARLFLYDADAHLLLPAFRPATAGPAPPLGWAPGQGVTGVAYERREYVLATGERTHDDTYNLSEEMKNRYASLTAVAATPVWSGDDVIGVLAISSSDPETRLDTDDAYWEHLDLAEQVSVALVDLLGFRGLTPLDST